MNNQATRHASQHIWCRSQARITVHYNQLIALCLDYLVTRSQKDQINLDLLEQEIVSGIGISWAICKSAPHATSEIVKRRWS